MLDLDTVKRLGIIILENCINVSLSKCVQMELCK